MENLGWIMLHRSIKTHWIWASDNRFKWWIDILLSVNHSEKKVLIKNTLVDCGRGQSIKSLDSWAKDWNVTKKTVSDFFKLLQKDEMIFIENLKITTRLTVCNYDSYNDSVNATETQRKRNVNATETLSKRDLHTNNNVNNVNNVNNENNESLMFDFLQKSNESLSEIEKITFEFWKLFKSNLEILKIEPTTLLKAKMGEWSNQTRLMIENKECTIEELREIFIFLKNSDFWRKNIVSMRKLRNQREKLLMESRSEHKKPKQGDLFAVNPDIRNNPDRLKFRKS